jgi:hypothetical protein
MTQLHDLKYSSSSLSKSSPFSDVECNDVFWLLLLLLLLLF